MCHPGPGEHLPPDGLRTAPDQAGKYPGSRTPTHPLVKGAVRKAHAERQGRQRSSGDVELFHSMALISPREVRLGSVALHQFAAAAQQTL